MLVDVHSHYFAYPEHFTDDFRNQVRRARSIEVDLTVRWPEYQATASLCDKTIVSGGKVKLSDLQLSGTDMAAYARQGPDKRVITACLASPIHCSAIGEVSFPEERKSIVPQPLTRPRA